MTDAKYKLLKAVGLACGAPAKQEVEFAECIEASDELFESDGCQWGTSDPNEMRFRTVFEAFEADFEAAPKGITKITVWGWSGGEIISRVVVNAARWRECR